MARQHAQLHAPAAGGGHIGGGLVVLFDQIQGFDRAAARDLQRKIAGMLKAMPKRRLLSDAIGAFKSMT